MKGLEIPARNLPTPKELAGVAVPFIHTAEHPTFGIPDSGFKRCGAAVDY